MFSRWTWKVSVIMAVEEFVNVAIQNLKGLSDYGSGRISNWRLNLSMNWLPSTPALISSGWLAVNRICGDNVLACHRNLHIFSIWLYYCGPPGRKINFQLESFSTVFAILSPFAGSCIICFCDVTTNKYIDRHLSILLIVSLDYRSFIIFFLSFNMHFTEWKSERNKKHYVLKLAEKENSVDAFLKLTLMKC